LVGGVDLKEGQEKTRVVWKPLVGVGRENSTAHGEKRATDSVEREGSRWGRAVSRENEWAARRREWGSAVSTPEKAS